MMNVEICANSLQSAINAQLGGANRVELCTNLEAGGTTPTAATIQLTTHTLKRQLQGQTTKVFVLIRPRQGDFCYTPLELGLMRRNILFCKSCNVDGIVTGVLDRNEMVDPTANKNLRSIAGPLACTFHRAFDRIADQSTALEQIIDLGFERILTSGGAATAWEGRENIARLVEQARDRISIMPGAGINADNIKALADFTGAREFHFSAKQLIHPQGKTDALFEASYWETSVEEVERTIRAL